MKTRKNELSPNVYNMFLKKLRGEQPFNYALLWKMIGWAGLAVCLASALLQPSFLTPDKLILFVIFIGIITAHTQEFMINFLPFMALLLIYESFRGIANNLNSRVHYYFMPNADRFLFGGHLPTLFLQQHFLHTSHAMWYDFVFYIVYMLHFVIPFILGLLILRFHKEQYARFATTFVVVAFAGFITYVLFPAAPPWMASQQGVIGPTVRAGSLVASAIKLHDLPTLYHHFSPNSVAALPSLHAAFSFLCAFFATKIFKSKWKYIAWLQPVIIWVGTVYAAEHYVVDVILGLIYALIAYYVAPYLFSAVYNLWVPFRNHLDLAWEKSMIYKNHQARLLERQVLPHKVKARPEKLHKRKK